jgi:hypothetical protein
MRSESGPMVGAGARAGVAPGSREARRTAPSAVARLLAPLARPGVAGLVALVVYLIRASLSGTGLGLSSTPYFNLLADAFLHGQLHLRQAPESGLDLVFLGDKAYLYWPPFPALLIAPLVALFGVGVGDVLYTVVLGALTIAILAKLLAALDETGLAPLSVERRALLVVSLAFGSVLLILAPRGTVWFTAQIVGWGCVTLATLAALVRPGKLGYFLTGLALACATTTRVSLLFNGVWLALYLLWRDRKQPLGRRAAAAACGLAPLAVALALFGLYNAARFGSPTEMGLAWHNVNPFFREDFERYGAFDLHYLPTNLYWQFLAHPLFATGDRRWMGGGLFWMTPILLGAPYAVWRGRRDWLVWALVASCALIYIPIGLLMGTGYITFGPRYLLDLMVPLLVLTALGIRRWPLPVLAAQTAIGCTTYLYGSWLWLLTDERWGG